MTNVPTRAAAAYGRAAQAVPPVRRVVMLYDGAIARLGEARLAALEGRFEDRYVDVGKAGAIVDALHAALDFERGGDIAPLLDRLYVHFGLRMQQINTRNDPGICDEVAARLAELRDAWLSIADGTSPASSPLSADTGRSAVAA